MNLYNALRNGIWKRDGKNIIVYRCNILGILKGYKLPLFEKKVYKEHGNE